MIILPEDIRGSEFIPLVVVGYCFSVMAVVCFQTGQNRPQTMVTIAFLDLMMSLQWTAFHYFNLHNSFVTLHYEEFSINNGILFDVQWSFFITMRFLLSFQYWVFVIFKGQKPMLNVWIYLSILTDVGIIGNMSYICLFARDFSLKDPLWIPSMVCFLAYRIYITGGAMLGLCQMYRDERYVDYQLPTNRPDTSMEPLGLGCCGLFSFMNELPGWASKVFLTVEMLWQILNLTTRILVQSVFGIDLFFINLGFAHSAIFLLVEETVIRGFRLLLAVIGYFFVTYDKSKSMRFWVFFYFLTLALSDGFMITAILLQLKEWPPIQIIIFHSLYFFCDNLFRLLLIFYTTKYAITYKSQIASKHEFISSYN